MRSRRAPVVLTFRATRQAVVVALVGLVAILVGFVAPLSAQAGGAADEANVHKSYVCKYVGTPGVDERLQTGDNPIYVDNHAIAGKESVEVGDLFADAHGFSIVIVANTPKLDPEPGIDQCPGYVPPTTTTTTQPTTTEPTTTEPTTTEPTTTQPTTTEPTTSQPVVTTTPVETPDTGATVAPTTQEPGEAATVRPTEEAPQVGAVTENVVPRAATDGADLATGWTGFRYALVGAGFLLLAAAGLLSIRVPAKGQTR